MAGYFEKRLAALNSEQLEKIFRTDGIRNPRNEFGAMSDVLAELYAVTGVPPWARSLFNGLAQIIVQSTRDAGEIKLTATADGLTPATAAVQTQPPTVLH